MHEALGILGSDKRGKPGFPASQWGVEQYGKLLEIGGGKERMLHYFSSECPARVGRWARLALGSAMCDALPLLRAACEDREPFKSIKGKEERWEFLKELHLLKTGIFQAMIEAGSMPLRPGVQRLIQEALDSDVKVAVCSTSNEKAVQTIVDVMLGPEISKHVKASGERVPQTFPHAAGSRGHMPSSFLHNHQVFVGDVVPKKKPDPAIYLLAAEKYAVEPARCVVIEDSRIGLLAGKAAGMRVVVTKSSYTQNENFDIAGER